MSVPLIHVLDAAIHTGYQCISEKCYNDQHRQKTCFESTVLPVCSMASSRTHIFLTFLYLTLLIRIEDVHEQATIGPDGPGRRFTSLSLGGVLTANDWLIAAVVTAFFLERRVDERPRPTSCADRVHLIQDIAAFRVCEQ